MQKIMKFAPIALVLSLSLPSWIPPVSAAQSAAALPELATKRLMNGLQIIVASTPERGDEMTIGWLLRYGSAFDPASKAGLAYVVSQMLSRATTDRSRKDIQDELAFLQASLDIRCDWDQTEILLRGRSSTYERALLLLYQIVGEAVFRPEDLEEVKAERLAQLGRPEDPRQRIRSLFERELFAGTTYGRPQRGSAATLQNIGLGDVKFFYHRFFTSDEAALVFTGSTPSPEVLQKATRIWGIWVRKEAVPFTFLPPRPPATRTVVIDNDPQSLAAQFIMGGLWPQRGEAGYYAAELATRVLQERLTKALPTSLLTVGSEGRRLPGPFYIQGQAAADQAPAEIQKILATVDSVKESGCTPQELDAARSSWLAEFRKSLATTEGVCVRLLEAELYRLGTNYLVSFDESLGRIDADGVKEAAKEWLLPGGALLLVRGPAATLRTGLANFGTLREAIP
jgi:zinc protease